MTKVRKINIFSFAKFQALLFALVGLFLGILYSFGGLAIDILVSLEWIVSTDTPGLSYGTVLAFGALVGMPLIGLIIGLITGLIEAVLYNIFARFFGGVDMDFKKRS